MKTITCLVVGLMLLGGAALAQEPAEKLQEVAPGLFVVTGLTESGNPAFLVTSEGVAVIDAGDSPAAGRRIVELVRSKTGQPIRYLILTHYHSDHTLGVESFPSGTQVIGRSRIEANMQRAREAQLQEYPKVLASLREKVDRLRQNKDPQLDAEELRLAENQRAYENLKTGHVVVPQLAFEGQLTLRLGGEVIEVISPGATHTNDSAIVRFPGKKAVHLGDTLFVRSYPYIDARAECNTKRWIEYLNEVQGWDVNAVIPGHGPVADKAAIAAQVVYLTDLRREVGAAVASGASLETTLEQVKKTMSQRYGGYEWPEGLVYGISAVYKELSAAPKR
jgi:cyclase